LITIEGIDGAGKSTLAGALAAALRRRGVRLELLHEPGGTPLSERIAELVKDPSIEIGAPAEALLYASARAQLTHERLRPLLRAGRWVLLDRFVDSSLAYQGVGRELGVERVEALNLFAVGDLTPDRTLLLRIDPEHARKRLRTRDAQPDRLELEGERFFAAIAAAYERLAEADPARIRAIDAEPPLEGVLEQALAALEDLLRTPTFERPPEGGDSGCEV
jgi:dTMP kinase